jgi:hypothetical protein
MNSCWSIGNSTSSKDTCTRAVLYHYRQAIRLLRQHFGSLPAADFGPRKLQIVREAMIADGHKQRGGIKRSYLKDHVSIFQRLFRWGVAQELVPASGV